MTIFFVFRLATFVGMIMI